MGVFLPFLKGLRFKARCERTSAVHQHSALLCRLCNRVLNREPADLQCVHPRQRHAKLDFRIRTPCMNVFSCMRLLSPGENMCVDMFSPCKGFLVQIAGVSIIFFPLLPRKLRRISAMQLCDKRFAQPGLSFPICPTGSQPKPLSKSVWHNQPLNTRGCLTHTPLSHSPALS